jgi:hypothetical protein
VLTVNGAIVPLSGGSYTAALATTIGATIQASVTATDAAGLVAQASASCRVVADRAPTVTLESGVATRRGRAVIAANANDDVGVTKMLAVVTDEPALLRADNRLDLLAPLSSSLLSGSQVQVSTTNRIITVNAEDGFALVGVLPPDPFAATTSLTMDDAPTGTTAVITALGAPREDSGADFFVSRSVIVTAGVPIDLPELDGRSDITLRGVTVAFSAPAGEDLAVDQLTLHAAQSLTSIDVRLAEEPFSILLPSGPQPTGPLQWSVPATAAEVLVTAMVVDGRAQAASSSAR